MKPVRISKAGKSYGGRPFGRGELYALLSNPIYIGRIRHKGVLHQGLHPAIIDLPVWDAVQQQLKDQRSGERHIRSAAHRSLLAGKLVDENGQPLVASHASKGAQRYRYYVSRDLQLGGKDAKANGLRIPAAEIEQLVCARLAERLDDPVALIEQINPGLSLPDSISNIIAICRDTVAVLRGADHPAIAQLIASVVERIEVRPDGITIKLDRNNIAASLNINASAEDAQPIEIAIAVKLKRAGFALRLVLPSGKAALPQTDDRLLKTIATAREWWKQLMADPKLRIADLAAANATTESWVTRVLRLAFLEPAIVQQIISGTVPVALTFDSLRAPDAIPALWSAQRALHRISSAR